MASVMSDKHISATAGAAGVFWLAGLGLMVAGAFDLRLMGWGIWTTGVAGVLTVQRMMSAHQHMMRNAFELGRDYERRDASVHSLR